MRILVVSEHPEAGRARGAALSRAGFEVAGCASRLGATVSLRRLQADATAILDDARVPLDVRAIRVLVDRLRGAAESSVPTALLLGDDSVWLRARPAGDLAPIVALRLDAPARELGEALERLASEAGPFAPASSATPRLDVRRREVTGPLGTITLTPSELSVAWELATAEGAVVSYEALSMALWGVPADRPTRTALRSHLHTLRTKLRRVALTLEIENRPGVGYRLAAPLAVRAPRG